MRVINGTEVYGRHYRKHRASLFTEAEKMFFAIVAGEALCAVLTGVWFLCLV